ncbi:Hypothetical_protein [Hexamita inflata]|uniref:Hypothetical_protein n=1 Tax=Hexamita inflata TaxID=28002 RepID=A0AA86S5K2_9EUKA|nr:Hypothetical protein HINF_LOCUS66070 [Hexamita inflata]
MSTVPSRKCTIYELSEILEKQMYSIYRVLGLIPLFKILVNIIITFVLNCSMTMLDDNVQMWNSHFVLKIILYQFQKQLNTPELQYYLILHNLACKGGANLFIGELLISTPLQARQCSIAFELFTSYSLCFDLKAVIIKYLKRL